VATTTASVRQRPHERHDRWWVEPLTIVLVLGLFGVYAFVVSIQNANYFHDPYLSPFYSPCLTTGCVHPTFPIIGDWYNLSPAFLIVGSPLAFRATCYYYRRSYYRAFFWSPPACTVPDARAKYSGETKFPWIIQNIHRYALYLAIPVLAILWWDAIGAFNFGGRFGIGLGTLITTNHIRCEGEVKALLGIPDDVLTYALMPIGYPEDKFGPVKRRPVNEVAFADRWGSSWPG